jgi:Asp-tRNA(Asn)/Glu-tRNA(Gln) amidotransferase A subunit family amidase
MNSKELQVKIEHLKNVLKNFTSKDKMIGVTIIRENSSDNWLFNTHIDITSIVPTVTQALEKEIAQLEEELIPILEEEARLKAIQDELDRVAEEERLEQERIQAEKDAIENEYKSRVALGNKLVKMYLMDNSVLNLTTQESLEQLQKFSTIKALLELGSLKAAKELIMLAETDKIFTEERKVKYLSYL